MQVTLTPYAAELLCSAIAQHPAQSASEILEQALAERVERESAVAPSNLVWERLKTMPGVTLPDHWPPRFDKFEPLLVKGEPLSEQLIRERR